MISELHASAEMIASSSSQLVIGQSKGVRAVRLKIVLLNKLRIHAGHAVFRAGLLAADKVLHLHQIITVSGMLRK